MSKIVGTVAAILLVAAGAAAQEKAPLGKADDATEKLLIANERALYGAVANADKTSFQSLVVPEGVWTTAYGFVLMGSLADGLGQFQVPKWGIENARVIWSDDNAALLSYARTGGGQYGDQSFAPVTLASTLWAKRNGKWVAVHHQETDLVRP